MTLNDRIATLEQEIEYLTKQINNLFANLGKKDQPPVTTFGGSKITGTAYPVDASSGLSTMSGGAVIWNETEINAPYGVQPEEPTIGYNKHSHSRFSGGALIKNVIEIVEYEWDYITNKHSQGFLKPDNQPKIKKTANTKGEAVENIGKLDLVFNPDTETWGCAAYEIDVRKCSLVMRDTDGEIIIDERGNQMKSPLYSSDPTKTSVVWDESGNCWRLLAVYAEGN